MSKTTTEDDGLLTKGHARLTAALADAGTPWRTPEEGVCFARTVLGEEPAAFFFALKAREQGPKRTVGDVGWFYAECVRLCPVPVEDVATAS